MSRGFTKAATGRAEIEADISTVRERIATLADQIEDLQAAPVSVDDALARLDAIAQNIGASGEPKIGGFFSPTRGPAAHELGLAGDQNPFLYWLLRDLIRERLAEEIQKWGAEAGTGISRVDREHKLEKLRLSLRSAEVEEENMIRTAEVQGMRLARRPDADPAIVLSEQA